MISDKDLARAAWDANRKMQPHAGYPLFSDLHFDHQNLFAMVARMGRIQGQHDMAISDPAVAAKLLSEALEKRK